MLFVKKLITALLLASFVLGFAVSKFSALNDFGIEIAAEKNALEINAFETEQEPEHENNDLELAKIEENAKNPTFMRKKWGFSR